MLSPQSPCLDTNVAKRDARVFTGKKSIMEMLPRGVIMCVPKRLYVHIESKNKN